MKTYDEDDEGRRIYKFVPGRFAQIEWREHERRVARLMVFNRETEFQDEPARQQRHKLYPLSHGACVAGWMDGKRARSTPEGQFADWSRDGFADQYVMLDALDQLGRIEESEWARTMAKAMREMMRQENGNGEDVRLLDPFYAR